MNKALKQSHNFIDGSFSSQHQILITYRFAQHLQVILDILVVKVQTGHAIFVSGLPSTKLTSYPVMSQYLGALRFEAGASMAVSGSI